MWHGVTIRTIGILALVVFAAAARAGPSCTCRANGQKFEQGQILCIRGKLARCEMFLNNSSWKIISDICPQASLSLGAILPAPRPQLLPRSSLPSC